MITLTVLGMECGHCVRSVTDAARTVPGVQAADVDLTTGCLRVDGSPDVAALRQAIAQAGYDTAP